MVLRLQLPANQNFQYRAGQYIEFILRDGARRSYSHGQCAAPTGQPAGDRAAPAPHAGGKFTDHVFGAMKEKDILRMEGPFGSFFLREDSKQADGAAGQRAPASRRSRR
jgi:CDP-4-dehydro-6-deoxyglucose reductase